MIDEATERYFQDVVFKNDANFLHSLVYWLSGREDVDFDIKVGSRYDCINTAAFEKAEVMANGDGLMLSLQAIFCNPELLRSGSVGGMVIAPLLVFPESVRQCDGEPIVLHGVGLENVDQKFFEECLGYSYLDNGSAWGYGMNEAGRRRLYSITDPVLRFRTLCYELRKFATDVTSSLKDDGYVVRKYRP